MSRVAKNPIHVPAGVEVTLSGQSVKVKSSKGELMHEAHALVEVNQNDSVLTFAARNTDTNANAQAGTTRSLINNMVLGVSKGFEKKLTLIGVGYRAQSQGNKLNLSLGFSHPVVYDVPEGIIIETPSQTEVIVKGIDKQKVGQVAANIRAYRPPEPYKGKGVRYTDEHVIRKEAKKK
ncbi:MAG: 50S ribosomal protein L6 [Ectothiorhodospiraceae bacterium]|nr:50S ribosomal protein L6 [Ectothiorhodospiraceae bacterium]